MTGSLISQRREEKGNIRSQLKENRISLKDIQERSGKLKRGKKYHYNTVMAAFDKDNKYWSKELIALAKRMIREKMVKDPKGKVEKEVANS